jgi:hypothetical protein
MRFRLLATVFQSGCYSFRSGGRQRLQLILRSLLAILETSFAKPGCFANYPHDLLVAVLPNIIFATRCLRPSLVPTRHVPPQMCKK